MTREEWAEQERRAIQEAATAHERAVVAQAETTTAPPADPLLAWLDNAPTGDPGTETAITAALYAVLAWHPQDEHGWCASLSHPRNFVPFEECPDRAEIAEALGVAL